MYYIYLLRCKDDSLYCGIAPDIKKRMKIHFDGGKTSSKYVRSKGALNLEIFWECGDKSEASKLEYRLKQLTRERKEGLISGEYALHELLSEKLDCAGYKVGNKEITELAEYVRGRCDD